VFEDCIPSGAKARVVIGVLMYGLKPVPFIWGRIFGTTEVVPFQSAADLAAISQNECKNNRGSFDSAEVRFAQDDRFLADEGFLRADGFLKG